jgi:hypothetical protein
MVCYSWFCEVPYLYKEGSSLIFHGWKSIGRLFCSILVCFFSIFLSMFSRLIIEGFWHARDIEERSYCKQTMQIRYDECLFYFFVNFERVLTSYPRFML